MTEATFSHLPAVEPERWARSRMDWPGAARMAAARAAVGLALSDTDAEALRRASAARDEAPPKRGHANLTDTSPALTAEKGVHAHRTEV